MKTYLDCIPCFINQTLKAGRLVTNDEKMIKEMLNTSGALIEKIPMNNTPAETGAMIYENIRQISGVQDAYKEIKRHNIMQAKEMYPGLKEMVRNSENPLLTAIRVAIAGNIIDFGVNKDFNLADDVERILKQDFAIFDFEAFQQQLSQAKNILYLGDNAGESVFDKLLIEEMNKPVTYAVRDVPVINDAVIEDAIESGLGEVASIISSGSKAPGTILNLCNDEFIDLFYKADMIISKGQGNYEGLSEADRPVFFLLKAKCQVIARDLNVANNDIVLLYSGNMQKTN